MFFNFLSVKFFLEHLYLSDFEDLVLKKDEDYNYNYNKLKNYLQKVMIKHSINNLKEIKGELYGVCGYVCERFPFFMINKENDATGYASYLGLIIMIKIALFLIIIFINR